MRPHHDFEWKGLLFRLQDVFLAKFRSRFGAKIGNKRHKRHSSAIQHNGTAAFVYVIQNSQAALRKVKTGVSDAGTTAVQGVNEGEVVANSSFEKLQNGAKVIISKEPLPGSSGSSSSGGIDGDEQ